MCIRSINGACFQKEEAHVDIDLLLAVVLALVAATAELLRNRKLRKKIDRDENWTPCRSAEVDSGLRTA